MAILKNAGRSNTNSHSETEQMLPEIRKTLEVFQQGNEIVEIRILKAGTDGKTTLSSYFTLDDRMLDKLKADINRHQLFKYSIYMTLNKVKADVIDGKPINTIKTVFATTKDKDIESFRFIHVDLDPERATNTQATAAEIKHAEDLMYQIKAYLSEQGFSEPILSFSGNGYNLDYRVDLPNTKENSQLIKAVLTALSAMFSNEYVKVDTTTYNAARIIKLFGCWSRKGVNTQERPHRQSRILSVPEAVQLTDRSIIESFVKANAKTTAKNGRQQTSQQIKPKGSDTIKKTAKIRDVSRWLDSHHLSYTIKDEDDRILYVLDVCPFNHEHERSSFVQVFEDGNVFFKCHHDHCSEYTIHDVLKLFPVKDRQIPLMEERDDTSRLFNAVGDQFELILTPKGERYIRYNDEVIPFSSEKVGSYIRKIAQEIGQLPSDNAVKRIKGNIESHYDSIPDTDRKRVGNRILMCNGFLLYACSHSNIQIIGNGNITQYRGNNVYFVKRDGVIGQLDPDLSIRPEKLPDLIRASFNINEDSLLRFLAQMLCFYIPNINTPIFVLSGAQGTSKTNEGVSECNEGDSFNVLIKAFVSSTVNNHWTGRPQDLLPVLVTSTL